ncbi:MAG: hypothetical protein QOJ64_794 [Acidobacteriota bacterium]|nr:hypothetical protein [Acidobacteriota bacterium]
MRHCHGHVLLIPAALSVTACAVYLPRTPILPERFEGPLNANADSLVSSTQALYCAPARHLDFGTTPQGCVRVAGDMQGWVNWTGTNRVLKVGRQWIQPDGVSAMRVGRSMEIDLAGKLGPSVECHYPHNPTWHEVRWITTDSASISTVLRIDDAADRTAPASVVLLRTLGPERCGYHNDRPWTH